MSRAESQRGRLPLNDMTTLFFQVIAGLERWRLSETGYVLCLQADPRDSN